MIVIGLDSKFRIWWRILETWSQLTSSYLYAYMAAFEDKNDGPLFHVQIVYETIFLISMGLKFLYEQDKKDSEGTERDLSKIAMHYLRGEFLFDLIPLIPLVALDLGGYERLFYLIKIIRLVNGFQVFSVPVIMEKIKLLNKKRLMTIIENDPVLAENVDEDNNKISALIFTNFTIKIVKLVIIILNISYFIGMFWYIFCDLTEQIFYLFDDPN